MESPSKVERFLELLGYDRLWLSLGAIDGEVLSEQAERFLRGGAQDPEHFRWESFQRIVGMGREMSDAEVSVFLQLAERDSSRPLSLSALYLLLDAAELSASQMLHVAQSSLRPDPRKVLRAEMLGKLKADVLDEQTAEACLRTDDAVVQRALLGKGTRVPLKAAEFLAQNGASRAVRNLALQWLRKRERD